MTRTAGRKRGSARATQQDEPAAKPDRSGGVRVQAEDGATGGSDAGDAYPRPYAEDDDEEGKIDGFSGHGGQSDMAYHGTGRLGTRKTAPEGNPNSATGED